MRREPVHTSARPNAGRLLRSAISAAAFVGMIQLSSAGPSAATGIASRLLANIPTANAASSTAVPVRLDAKTVVASVRSAALVVAAGVGATLGTPACPVGLKAAAGLTFQCIVAFDRTPVPFLVTIRPDGGLTIRPTFPVISLATVRGLVAANATCGPAKARFLVQPVGSDIECRTGTGNTAGTVLVRVLDDRGTLRR